MHDIEKRIKQWLGRKIGSKIAASIKQFTQDAIYLEEHKAELTNQYPGMWAAFYRGNLTIGSTMEEALRKQPSHRLERARRETAIISLDPLPKHFILYAT